jgi:sarcosine oxidase subunit alpha
MKTTSVDIVVNGKRVSAFSGATVAVALLNSGESAFRQSVAGESRGPVCGMGICYECRVTINDVPQQRACLRIVENGMRVDTGASGAG